ncbi:ATP-binding cassette domain-containing protein [Streptomyces sp. NPDC050560]|uniref:ATP-binding cassette domain-containing protein n=1 Tax=Streptomyces sp. NPDC050560 TaxID=3365630 RepID=UPI0037908824
MTAIAAEETPPVPAGVTASVVRGTKSYWTGGAEVRVLDGVTVDFPAGSLTALMGPPGSGKSTLVRCASGMERLTAGRVYIGDTNLGELDDRERVLLRRRRVGFLFQAPSLLAPPAGQPLPPKNLAGTRAVVRAGGRPGPGPDVVFVDEPACRAERAVDTDALAFLLATAEGLCATVVAVTHDPRVASHAHRVVFLDAGRVVATLEDPTEDGVRERVLSLGRDRGAAP